MPSAAWYYRPAWILALALVAIGPIALILVWKSPQMSRAEKIVMATAIVVYTALTVYFMYKLTALELRYMRQFSDVMRQIDLR